MLRRGSPSCCRLRRFSQERPAGRTCTTSRRTEPLEASAFFPDGSSARAPIEGTVARGHLRDDAALYTGRTNDALVTTLPVPLDERLVRRGREMFDAYCAPCHGRTGDANGMIVQRGFTRPPSLFVPRLRELPHGHIFEVITNGFGAMPDHAAQIQVLDRWAIVTYVRALQLSASASIADVPPAERARLER